MIQEIKLISEGQQILILKLTQNMPEQKTIASETKSDDSIDNSYASKKEFIKLNNETAKALRDINKRLKRIEIRLKLKSTSLDRY